MSPLRQKQMRTKLRVLENNFINSVGDKDFKRAADELNRYRQVVSEHKIKGRSDDDIMKAWQDRKQEGLRSGRLAGYQKGVIDPKTGKRVFASAVDNPNAKDIINNPLVDIADVVSSAFIVGALTKVGIKGAAALIKDPSLFTKLPQQSKNLVTNVVNRIKGKQPMAKKQVLKVTDEKWFKDLVRGTGAARKQALEEAAEQGASKAQVKNLKNILYNSGKNAGKVNPSKLKNLSKTQRDNLDKYISKKVVAPTVASDLAKVGGASAATWLAWEQFVPDEYKQRLTDAKYAKRIAAARKPRELSEREKEAKKSGKKPETVSKTSYSGPELDPKPQKVEKVDKKVDKKVAKKKTPPKPIARPDQKNPRKLTSTSDELKVERQNQARERNRNRDTMDVTGAKEKREGLRAATQLADQEKKVSERKKGGKKKKTGDSVKESLKDMIFKQDKRKYGPFTVDSTDRGMSKYGDSDNWKELEAEEEMNLRKGGTARRKAFGKGGMYKTPKKAYGMRKGGFTRRGASR